MVIDERSRHELFTRLEQVLGEDHAAVLMQHLPPLGWGDVATKADIAATKADIAGLREYVDIRFDAVEGRLLAAFHKELSVQTRIYVSLVVSMFVGTLGAMVALARV